MNTYCRHYIRYGRQVHCLNLDGEERAEKIRVLYIVIIFLPIYYYTTVYNVIYSARRPWTSLDNTTIK